MVIGMRINLQCYYIRIKTILTMGNFTKHLNISLFDRALRISVITLLTVDWDAPEFSLEHSCVLLVARKRNIVISTVRVYFIFV